MTKSANDVVVLSAIRSPITRSFKGGFKDAWPEDILGPVREDLLMNCTLTHLDNPRSWRKPQGEPTSKPRTSRMSS